MVRSAAISQRERGGLYTGPIRGVPERDRRAVKRPAASRLDPVSTQREEEIDAVRVLNPGRSQCYPGIAGRMYNAQIAQGS